MGGGLTYRGEHFSGSLHSDYIFINHLLSKFEAASLPRFSHLWFSNLLFSFQFDKLVFFLQLQSGRHFQARKKRAGLGRPPRCARRPAPQPPQATHQGAPNPFRCSQIPGFPYHTITYLLFLAVAGSSVLFGYIFLFVFQAVFDRDAYFVIIPSHKCHKCKETFLLMLKKRNADLI